MDKQAIEDLYTANGELRKKLLELNCKDSRVINLLTELNQLPKFLLDYESKIKVMNSYRARILIAMDELTDFHIAPLSEGLGDKQFEDIKILYSKIHEQTFGLMAVMEKDLFKNKE